MARYIRFTEDKIKEFEKDGRGKGALEDYKPWLQVGEIRSEGRSHRIPGFLVKRVHHFFSDLEMSYFYLVSWDNDILDIREQYPLPRTETLRIAEKLDYEHPKYTDTQVMTVMTTDFLLTVRSEFGSKIVACAVKPANKVIRSEENRRTIEKLWIEKGYWEESGVKWNLVTEDSFDMVRVRNIMFLAGRRNNPLQHNISKNEMMTLTKILSNTIVNHSNLTIAHVCKMVDQEMSLEPGDAIAWMHYMAALKIIPVRIDSYGANAKAEIAVDIEALGLRRKHIYEEIVNI